MDLKGKEEKIEQNVFLLDKEELFIGGEPADVKLASGEPWSYL